MPLYEIDFTKKTALVFGNEHSGVSKEVSVLSDGNFIIPQMGLVKSLNISVACAVALYEAFRQKYSAGHYDHPQLPEEQVQSIKQRWDIPGDE